MKKFELTYMSYEGNLRRMIVEAPSEDEVLGIALKEEGNYSSDNIKDVVRIEEC